MAPNTELYEIAENSQMEEGEETNCTSSNCEDESSTSSSSSDDDASRKRVTEDLFFDMGERWQTAFLEDQMRSPFVYQKPKVGKKRMPQLLSRVAAGVVQKVRGPSSRVDISGSSNGDTIRSS